MGNRAVILSRNSDLGIYLHWNGGIDSVEAFLTYCKMKGYTAPSQDCYGWARLTQVISNFIGGTNSIGIDIACKLDQNNFDNGVYVIDGWDIVERKYYHGAEQNEYELNDMIQDIDESQPLTEQFGKEYLESKVVNTSDLKLGDTIYYETCGGTFESKTVIGFGTDRNVNGRNVNGIPFVNYCGVYENNSNNYLRDASYHMLAAK